MGRSMHYSFDRESVRGKEAFRGFPIEIISDDPSERTTIGHRRPRANPNRSSRHVATTVDARRSRGETRTLMRCFSWIQSCGKRVASFSYPVEKWLDQNSPWITLMVDHRASASPCVWPRIANRVAYFSLLLSEVSKYCMDASFLQATFRARTVP